MAIHVAGSEWAKAQSGVDRHAPRLQRVVPFRVVTPWSVGSWERYQCSLGLSCFVFKPTAVRQMRHSCYRVVAG